MWATDVKAERIAAARHAHVPKASRRFFIACLKRFSSSGVSRGERWRFGRGFGGSSRTILRWFTSALASAAEPPR